MTKKSSAHSQTRLTPGTHTQEHDGLSNELVNLLGGQNILIIGPPLNDIAEDIFLI